MDFICLDGGPQFTFNEAVSFTVTCKDQDEIDYYWDKLSKVPESEQCGWCKDQFGVSWQIVPENMSELLAKGPAAIQTLMKQKKIVVAEY
jgi:predicted 3-demethylubiquinone-9 3-methyltransferase (glyoxalase superfamily)